VLPQDTEFSSWERWTNRTNLPSQRFPGVYIIAIYDGELEKKPFSWLREIVYVGMTNSASGLAGRLRQFDLTISDVRKAHGGADRVRFANPDYAALLMRLFVAVRPFQCRVVNPSPTDLRVMGDVAKFEFECLAHYSEIYGRLPQFNDKAESPKYSAQARKGELDVDS
jgi:hypothetical protein